MTSGVTYATPVRARPIVKWAGGKSKLLPRLEERFPEKVDTYLEPFVGGGSVALDVIERFGPKSVTINDINGGLINMYAQVRDHPEELIQTLIGWQEVYDGSDPRYRERMYMSFRDRYNRNLGQNTLDQAALFIFLNRTGFNGLYRVNRAGQMNVAWGKKDSFAIDIDNIREVSEVLRKVNLSAAGYETILDGAGRRKNTFVFMDPPYLDTFNGYSSDGFDQIRLAERFRAADRRGAKLMETNSYDTDFFPKHYGGYRLERIDSSSSISQKATGRGKKSEFVITNYSRRKRTLRDIFGRRCR